MIFTTRCSLVAFHHTGMHYNFADMSSIWWWDQFCVSVLQSKLFGWVEAITQDRGLPQTPTPTSVSFFRKLFFLWTFTKVHSKVERTFVKLHWTFHVEFELFTSLSSPSLRTLSFCEEDVTFEEKLFKLNCKLCFGEEKKVGNDSKLFEKSLGLKWGKKLEKYFQLQFSWDVEIFEIFAIFVQKTAKYLLPKLFASCLEFFVKVRQERMS